MDEALSEHQKCPFCGEQNSYEEYVSTKEREAGKVPRILPSRHATCEATIRSIEALNRLLEDRLDVDELRRRLLLPPPKRRAWRNLLERARRAMRVLVGAE